MIDKMDWWEDFERRLIRSGFQIYRESPVKLPRRQGHPGPSCLEGGCCGEPEYHDYFKKDEYLAFLVCPECGGVWNPETHERFH